MGKNMAAPMAQDERRPLRISASRHRSVALGLPFVALIAFGWSVASAQTSATRPPVRVAFDWMAALRSTDVTKLAALSQIPFVQEGFDRCSAKKAETPADLTVVLGCVAHSDPIFVASIPAEPAQALSDW